ncbi:MAG: cytochrome c oxidase subunit II transmembrane domain-containing protein, partial [Persicimonas sp.]
MSVDTQSTRLRKFLVPLAVALAVLLVPLVALAIPGSGDFVALESPSGRDITELYNIIAKICLIITIIVEGVLLVAILRFRRRSDDEQPEQVHGNLKLELAWTLAAV